VEILTNRPATKLVPAEKHSYEKRYSNKTAKCKLGRNFPSNDWSKKKNLRWRPVRGHAEIKGREGVPGKHDAADDRSGHVSLRVEGCFHGKKKKKKSSNQRGEGYKGLNS